jgi:predicted GNAT family acetyltransferase
MSTAVAKTKSHPRPAVRRSSVERVGDEHRDDLLAFLARRPVHTVCMASFIRDNGVVSPLNRGSFYAYYGGSGSIEGVALIGHATLVESESEAALRAFAKLTRDTGPLHLIRGEYQMIEKFWLYYSELGHQARLTCREFLFQNRIAPRLYGPRPDLRLATASDLPQVAQINSEMIFAECGVDPLKNNPEGFQTRLLRRLNQGRIWIWKRDDTIIFKADVFAETPEMMYLEGVYVAPEERSRGVGQNCLTHLTHHLLRRSESICLLLNEDKLGLQRFYQNAGFKNTGTYETIYFNQ